METFETLSGAAFIKMEPQDDAALSRDELLRLVLRSRAIVTAIATLSTETANPLSVAEILNMQPQEIAALSEQDPSSTSSSSLLPSEPLPWRPNTRPKLPSGALLDIDQGPLYDILTEWLRMEDVCHLDSALCQKWRRRREEFLALLATKVLLFNREEIKVLVDPNQDDPFTHRALGAAALSWILKRGIHLASLRLPYSRVTFSAEQESIRVESIREAVASLALHGHLDKLETIHLSYCSYIKDADLTSILSKCYSSVKSIDIRGCIHLNESAAAHIKRCTKLEAFTPKGNESAADMVEIFKACRKLRKVDFGSLGPRLTDEVVQSVAVDCPLLEHLGLGCCYAVMDAAIRKVAESCPLLQFVDLRHTNISDTDVVALCNHCPLLKRMFLGRCGHLTDAAVLVVAERLPGLTHIDLDGITAITSSALETLASKCRELEFIEISYCPNVSDATLAKIAEHCSKLEELRVRGTAVSSVGVAEVRSKCTKLKIVGFN
jgi:hypothetical protein